VRRFMPVLAVRRFLIVLAGMGALLTVSAIPATAATSAVTTAGTCTSAAAATYRHTFDGPAGKVTVTAVRPLCAGQKQTFSLVSYTTGALSSASGQFLYDSAEATITSTKRTVSLDIAVPACFTQVDAIMGTAVRTETTSTAAPYGTATLGSTTGTGSRSAGARAWYAGGATACTATSTISFTNACDGTFTATLANDDSANAQAVFLTGSRRIRLSPGRTTTVKAAKHSTLTFRTSTFTTYVGTWRPPTAPCTTPARPARPAVAPVAAPPTRAAAAPATASPSPAAVTSSAFTAEPPAPDVSLNPAALAGDEPSALAGTGSGMGSVIATAIGLLLVGGGVTVLSRLLRRPA
jgi:hypothetical protein